MNYSEKRSTLINVPKTNTISTPVTIKASAAEVWSIVGDFSGFHKFVDGLERIEMTGEGARSVRKKLFEDGHVVIEQLNHRDEQSMLMDWSLIYTNMDIGNLWSSMRVNQIDNDHCEAIWDIAGEPYNNETQQADFESFVEGFARSCLNNVKEIAESTKAA
ncbi:TPA: SRPBCC family protein [Vibrio parahaemolyticus]|uniref:SRPBCC family protein n=2 Tax=Vibrio parahaemolyticus TaxID=670 RepID=UPI001869A67E|nr:SRPBCC family protein [Vibrio parahaemolyticus]MBE4218692.1 SRPBCC family protein [Vibrio parahaemolyticus]HAS6968772.1 SRPBCC family protein [Vibrio parahaemolyticus]HCE1981218.1 SRPBCC family protein [Vibrio parahaemolyticus]HCE3381104.1 SRPBCC family protein [Vibrio parahaemolyticus]HCE3712050.1 SRPBCC family protein [Vibrio parahaemolyticus]